jgi:hypothetical protein
MVFFLGGTSTTACRPAATFSGRKAAMWRSGAGLYPSSTKSFLLASLPKGRQFQLQRRFTAVASQVAVLLAAPQSSSSAIPGGGGGLGCVIQILSRVLFVISRDVVLISIF